MWWPGGQDVQAGFVSVPDGAATDAGLLPAQSSMAYGATYLSASKKWVKASREVLSPDGTQYTYWKGDPSVSEVHVVDVATGSDRVAYSGQTLFIPIAFEPGAIYVVHGVQIRQGAFERLYRLDPSGGVPQLVPGSDRHMYQWGWVLIADGAAWGIDNRVVGSDYFYSVLRLDLATSEETQWLEAPLGRDFWPIGVDNVHRLYTSDGHEVWRIARPGQVEHLVSGSEVAANLSVGVSASGFVYDSHGAWFSGLGAVWIYTEGGGARSFSVGPANELVSPAGACT